MQSEELPGSSHGGFGSREWVDEIRVVKVSPHTFSGWSKEKLERCNLGYLGLVD